MPHVCHPLNPLKTEKPCMGSQISPISVSQGLGASHQLLSSPTHPGTSSHYAAAQPQAKECCH